MVHGPRAQADRALYRTAIQNCLAEYNSIRIIEAPVGDIRVKQTPHGNQVEGIITEDGYSYYCTSIVLTTGTFLGGLIHIGGERTPAGQLAKRRRTSLRLRLAQMELPVGRLNDFTSSRLDGNSIDWERCGDTNHADNPPMPFSRLRPIRSGCRKFLVGLLAQLLKPQKIND